MFQRMIDDIKESTGITLRLTSLALAAAVALFISDPERQGMVTGSAVRELLPLTPTEAEISASLANGFSVCETATRLGVAETTVRTHLRSIFAKTGVTRQPQLVHLIHTSLPELSTARA